MLTIQTLKSSNTQTQNQSGVTKPKVYNDMVDWRKKHENNAIIHNMLINDKSALEEYGRDGIDRYIENKRNEIGTEFDFMEGKDAKDEKQYLGQLDKLAAGDMASYDLDGDGKVSRSEYMAVETKDVR